MPWRDWRWWFLMAIIVWFAYSACTGPRHVSCDKLSGGERQACIDARDYDMRPY